MNEIIILLEKKEKLWLQGCTRNPEYPVPVALIDLLGMAGMGVGEEIIGLVSPEDEKRLLETLKPWITEKYGLSRVWKTVWMTPEKMPETHEERMEVIQGLYCNPESLDEIRRQQPREKAWEQLGWKISRTITPGNDEDLGDLLSEFLDSKLPLGEGDIEFMDWILGERLDLVKIPGKIPVKETLAIVLSHGVGEEVISSVTDILRAAYWIGTHWSIGRGNLKLSRPSRKLILGMLERYLGKTGLSWCLQDAKKYKDPWKILSQVCHPDPSKYPKAFEFFGKIQTRSEEMLRGWTSKLQKAKDSGKHSEVLRLLSQRPTEFIRQYDSILRSAWESGDTKKLDDTLDAFLNISGASGKSLLELYRYYDRRDSRVQRSYRDTSGVLRTYPSLPDLPQDILDVTKLGIIQALRKSWKGKSDFLGRRIYVDIPGDLEFPVSFRGQVVDKTCPLFPGQKISFETTGVIRFFTQWIDPHGTEDLDIHAWLFSEDLENFERVAWNTDFTASDGFITHSGDIRHQPGDCAEYLNIDYSKENPWFTWMLVTVENYDGESLLELENWVGISRISGEEAETLFRGKVALDSKDVVAFLVNVKEGWAKSVISGSRLSEGIIKDFIIRETKENTLGTKDLISWYIEDTGGVLVSEPREETEIIGMEDFWTGKIHDYLLG